MQSASTDAKANFGPFAAFMGVFVLAGALSHFLEGRPEWPFAAPMYWAYPLQTLLCGALLIHWWPRYRWGPAKPALGAAVGVLVFVIWISPRWLGAAPRLEGFRPDFFGTGAPYWANLLVRFVRLVVVVPPVEEIFWRGFLARYLINPQFETVPFGTFTRASFLITTAGFCLEHNLPDWPAALITGALYNFAAWRSRSLSTCVLAHAVTNLLLGLYVMRTHEWGYW